MSNPKKTRKKPEIFIFLKNSKFRRKWEICKYSKFSIFQKNLKKHEIFDFSKKRKFS